MGDAVVMMSMNASMDNTIVLEINSVPIQWAPLCVNVNRVTFKVVLDVLTKTNVLLETTTVVQMQHAPILMVDLNATALMDLNKQAMDVEISMNAMITLVIPMLIAQIQLALSNAHVNQASRVMDFSALILMNVQLEHILVLMEKAVSTTRDLLNALALLVHQLVNSIWPYFWILVIQSEMKLYKRHVTLH